MTEKKEEKLKRQSSIVSGKLVRTSVSQIKTFLDCPRKWWYDKRAKLPRKPPSKGQRKGDTYHKQIEHYLLHGEDGRGPLARTPEALRMLEPYEAHAPFRGGALLVEAELKAPTLFTPGGVEFVGYSDLILPPGLIDARPHVIDHKFRKDLEAYAETSAALLQDAQAIVYAAWAFSRWPESPSVFFAHHNHQTEGARIAFPVPVDLTLEHTAERFDHLCATVDGPMTESARQLRDLDVVAEEQSCLKFGGCDFLSTCPNAPARRFALSLIPGVTRPGIELKEDETMGLVDTVRKQLSQTGAPAPAAPPPAPAAPVAPPPAPAAPAAPPPAPAAPAAPGQIMAGAGAPGSIYLLPSGPVGRLEVVSAAGVFFSLSDGSPSRIAAEAMITPMNHDDTARRAFGLAPVAPAAPVEPRPLVPGSRHRIVDVTDPGAGASVAPPDQPRAARNPEELAAMNTASAPAAPAAPAAPPAAPAPEAPPADAPKRRGRPPGSKTKNAGTMGAAEAVATNSSLEGLILCVDAHPNRPATDLAAYVADLAATVAEAANVEDVRFAPKDNPLAFTAWKGAIAAAARESAPSGLCVIHSSDLADPVIEALIPLASLVIRGRK